MSGEDDDDEALTWAGARDPSYYESPEPKEAKPAGSPRRPRRTVDADALAGHDAGTPTAARDEADESERNTEDDETPSMSAFVLVCLGILGGLYALYTIGWFISWQHLAYAPSDVLELVAFQIQQVLAILAPPLWFVIVMLFTRRRRAFVRLLWLVVGAIVLIPWSWILER